MSTYTINAPVQMQAWERHSGLDMHELIGLHRTHPDQQEA